MGFPEYVDVTSPEARQFFMASADVGGAVIGLLFVAVSVNSGRRVSAVEAEVRNVRAAATLSAFTNAFAVAMFSLVPGLSVGHIATVVAFYGLLRMAGALVSVFPKWRAGKVRLWDFVFLPTLAIVYAVQLYAAIGLDRNRHNADDLETICILVVVCFLIGIARAWELVGGPTIDLLGHALVKRMKLGTPEDSP
jgi:hypothetical protein